MTPREEFAAEIEAFLESAKMDPTSFGRLAINDPNFVKDVREGRSPNLSTVHRVRQFMSEHSQAA